jgi:hypothetical protein
MAQAVMQVSNECLMRHVYPRRVAWHVLCNPRSRAAVRAEASLKLLAQLQGCARRAITSECVHRKASGSLHDPELFGGAIPVLSLKTRPDRRQAISPCHRRTLPGLNARNARNVQQFTPRDIFCCPPRHSNILPDMLSLLRTPT